MPKMHKDPTKQRHSAASHCCSIKPLPAGITKALKVVQELLTSYCKKVNKTSGVNCMWIVKNSVDVLEKIKECNSKRKIRNIRTYDFSTLYTSIPHDILKKMIAKVITRCFNNTTRKYIRIYDKYAKWSKTKGKSCTSWKLEDFIQHVNFLIDNIYVVCGHKVFRQVIGIPMGTDCAPFLANLFLFAYEDQFMQDHKNKPKIVNSFSHCFRYIDDLLCINNDQLMEKMVSKIYPEELVLTSDNAVLEVNYLHLNFSIIDDKIRYKLYDKRDSYSFAIVNFPDLSGNIPHRQSYGVFTSQLIRYARCCQFLVDFRDRTIKLIDRLLKQGFQWFSLRSTFTKFTFSYYYLLDKYSGEGVEFCQGCRESVNVPVSHQGGD